ncbi:hypothetical protein WICPIJ_005889 [Wickerhamomyces pijperi]|uniref:Uncharacterized protein n=1 Tax=Wickerhamomyces pijperi TaxID=599730 RepID=A0A9P8TLE3_WICPI|nr:hypothetical protein WICPIJ_005889 [Wickerhamomyces pijperi]
MLFNFVTAGTFSREAFLGVGDILLDVMDWESIFEDNNVIGFLAKVEPLKNFGIVILFGTVFGLEVG